MKKILMLGGAHSQIPAIKKAREMGHYVITCDYIKENPGHQYAHEYYNVSTTDKEGVLSLAKALNIDGIVSYASDPAAPTAAYVAERLGLPSHPYESVEILSNKDLFREFQKNNNFNVPRAKGYRAVEEAKADFHNFNMPVMIKPVDSSGSRGVSKIDSIDTLQEKIEYALSFSKVKRFIVEEYIEKHGYHVGGDGFSVNGKLVFRSFTNEHFPTIASPNPFVPIGSSWPCQMSEHIQQKIHKEIQRALTLLNMKSGAYNFDIRVDEQENVYLIEIAARNGGDWIPQVTKYATGVDLIEYTIKTALGEDCNDLTMVESQGYWSVYVLNSETSGVFINVEMHDEIVNGIVEYELLVKSKNHIKAFSGSNEKLGTMILKFPSEGDMLEKMEHITNFVKVNVEHSFVKINSVKKVNI
ncbi:acetyl-CoA carboxylase biotin carboxylase subunit family protein [Lysinibacillus sp. Ag94]|uniref:ATP-grasp domain-containing protein n=1 Tax=Lysinibacillus sp. Ag94 TaxID=2936682 RepID=UPI002010044C|nr:ATP-grasp domain-containing protein [Lysinibacillus sp. Ag94]UPW84240.1 ATP-grasp domain-containing protein [Lysinibacillus sp. Ag94]